MFRNELAVATVGILICCIWWDSTLTPLGSEDKGAAEGSVPGFHTVVEEHWDFPFPDRVSPPPSNFITSKGYSTITKHSIIIGLVYYS